MRVFVTGATGFIGSVLVPELIEAGHQVLGLSRSDAGAEALRRAGAEVQRGDVEDLGVLRTGVEKADAVIHLAFNHNFANYLANCESDRKVIEALGGALASSERPLIVTSGTAMGATQPGTAATENDPPAPSSRVPRAASEEAAAAAAQQGVRTMIVRLAQIHDTTRQGLVTSAVQVAREKGVSAYIAEGRNRWPAAPLQATAQLYRLALEKGTAGARYNAVAEKGVAMRDIAEAVGAGLKVPVVSLTPEEAQAHFGWLAGFAGWDIPASSAQTRQQLGWNPTGPSLIEDLRNMDYSTT